MKDKIEVVEYALTASEFDWEIKPGKVIRAWGFNNQVPGPVLRAKKGDTLVVKIDNRLTESTMIHWHGIRLPATMDGTEKYSNPYCPVKVSSTVLQYRMPEHSGIIHTKMKQCKWKGVCMGVSLLRTALIR